MTMSIVLDLQGLDAPIAEAALGSSISNNC
jgi:hypothetical protein